MRRVAIIVLIIGLFFSLIALAVFSWTERKPKGYAMEDGRKNPYPRGSAQAANWAKNNPKNNPIEVKQEIEPQIDNEDGTNDQSEKGQD